MIPFALKALGIGTVLAVLMSSQRKGPMLTRQQKAMHEIIVAEAVKQGVSARVALAFAWLESQFDPTAEGDKDWASKRPQLYNELVLNNVSFKSNPYRTDPNRWHSYGLFQLLAPYFVTGEQDPASLLDPRRNAFLGVRKIKSLMTAYQGDVAKTRLAFAGALELGPGVQKPILAKLTHALSLF